MKLLIVSATEMEIMPLLQTVAAKEGNQLFKVLIAGVGMTATAYSLTKHLQTNKYDFILQAGVGGSYDRNLSLGDVVFVTRDQFGDLGAEDHEDYLDIFEMALLEKNAKPFSNAALSTPLLPIHQKIDLPQVKGLTVNTVSGNELTIKNRLKKYGCAIESMEGAAFHYVCLQENVPFAQVRAISNYVTPRDKSQWKMKEAVINLNNWLKGFIESVK